MATARQTRFYERIPLSLRRVGAVALGVALAPLCIQAFYRLTFFAIEGWSKALTVAPAVAVLIWAGVMWKKEHRWFATGLAAGTVMWMAFLFWLLTTVARNMENFP